MRKWLLVDVVLLVVVVVALTPNASAMERNYNPPWVQHNHHRAVLCQGPAQDCP
jgi:hypothetical protein